MHGRSVSARRGFAVVVAAVIAVGATTASAAEFIVTGNTADGEVSRTVVADGGGTVSNTTKNGTLLSGTYNTNTIISPVFVFQLPTLAAGEAISSANLDVRVGRSGAVAFSADLYGLNARTTSAISGGDFFAGAVDTTDATLIQADIFTPSSATAGTTVGTSVSGDASLAQYLQAQYDAGNGGDYVFLRFSPDFDSNSGFPAGSFGFAISSAETSTKPTLTLTTIPEPSSAVLLGGGLLVAAGRRRRRGV